MWGRQARRAQRVTQRKAFPTTQRRKLRRREGYANDSTICALLFTNLARGKERGGTAGRTGPKAEAEVGIKGGCPI